MPTVAAASTDTMTAKTVNSPTTATTHGLRVLTPRVYARLKSAEVRRLLSLVRTVSGNLLDGLDAIASS